MSDPTNLSEQEKAKAALQQQAEEIDRLDRALSQQYANDAYPVEPVNVPEPRKERLFSRTSLLGWALGALLFVFIVRVVLPTVFDSIKETVIERMKEPTSNTAVQPAPVVAPVATPAAEPALPPKAATPATPAREATPASPAKK